MPLKLPPPASEAENYRPLLIVGLALALALMAGLSVYWLGDSARLASAAQVLKSGREERGRRIYAEQCTTCHGAQGEGGVGPALNDRRLLKNTPDDIFFSVIRSGVPNTQMPSWSVAFGGPLTDEEVRDVVAFLRSWEPQAPEVVQSTAEPDPARGALLFNSTCAICHGEEGRGGKEGIPALNDPQRLARFDDAWYRGVIANGRPARGMPTWGTVLSPGQLEDLVALLAVWRHGQSVQPSYSVAALIEQALFALSQEDQESASLHVRRAIEASQGAGAEVLRSAAAQLEAGDRQGAQAALQALQAEWPLGDAAAGAAIYGASCAPCHGVQGEGGIGLALRENAFIRGESNARLVEFILAGRPGTAMAGFEGRLEAAQVADVVAFLRLWQK